MEIKKTNKNLRYFLWTMFGLVLLMGGAFAVTTYSNTPSAYIDTGNITLNETGIYSQGGDGVYSKAYARTADVVVCRGTSVLDDIIKSFQCDVVCKSTDNDCSNKWQEAFNNGGTIFSYPSGATYPIDFSNSKFKDKCYSLIINNSNTILYGNGLTFELNGTRKCSTNNNIVLLITGNSVRVHDLSITNKTISDSSTSVDIGLVIADNSNTLIENVKVIKIPGFQIFASCFTKNLNHTTIRNSYFEGVGYADVIGGGANSGSCNVSDVYIENNIAIQPKTGSYHNSFDMVASTNINLINNVIYGSATFGSETGPTMYSLMKNNIIYPPIGSNYTQIRNDRTDSNYNRFIDNQIINGGLYIMGSNQFLQGNKIISGMNGTTNIINEININNSIINNNVFEIDTSLSAVNIQLRGFRNNINGNTVIGGNRGLYLRSVGGYNKIGNNFFQKTSQGTNPITILVENDFNTIENNNNFVSSTETIQNGIYVSNSDNNAISGNSLYNYGTITSDGIHIAGASSHNNSVSKNNFFGNKPSNAYIRLMNQTENYADNVLYTIPISTVFCSSNTSHISGKMIHNLTTSCVCTSSGLKCWEMS